MSDHLEQVHAEAFKDINHQLCSSRCAAPIAELEVEAPDGRLPLYYAVLAVKESAKMPTVGSSIDRRCIDSFLQRHNSENLSALMCFACARVLPRGKQDLTREIHWCKPFDGRSFARMDADATESTIGLKTYLAEYGQIPAPPNLVGEQQ